MATYLQGVTDYIPQFQPFQPDLNFYGNVMQTKQTQYDTNWKALNKMYNQYYNADLTRDSNVTKKDDYIKQADFNLKRVSQLDLSLEQNVAQATQVFKPLYEDKGLMKDMAWTKNYNNELNKAQSFQNAYDEKMREQYWGDGIKEMNYLKDEFKEATDSDAMNFGTVKYTPYVNVVEKAQKIAKDFGTMETVKFSDDKRFIITTRNGEQLTEPLQKLFEAQLGSDASIQAVYKTQSYVNRKDYAYGNAAQFSGDKNAAEMKYLEDSFTILKQKSTDRYKKLQENDQAYDAAISDLESQKKKGTASPDIDKAIATYRLNKDINTKVLTRAEEEQKQLNGGQSSTATTSTGFVNPYGDINSLRYKVDNGMASLLMQKDLDEAANTYAYSNFKQGIDSNPYAVMADKHRYSMSEIASRNAGLANAAKIRNAGERQTMMDKYKLESGSYYRDEQTGEILPYEGLNSIFTDPNDKGTAVGAINLKNTSTMLGKMHTENVAKPYLKTTLALIDKMVAQGTMSRDQASKIIGYEKNKNIDVKSFGQKLDKYGYNWLRSEVGVHDMANIQRNMSQWLSQNGQLSGLNGEEYKQYKDSARKFSDYTKYLQTDQKWRQQTSYEVERDLRKQGFKDAGDLYDEHGNMRSEKEYLGALANKGKGSGLSVRGDAINKLNHYENKMNEVVQDYMPKGQGSNAIMLGKARKLAANDPRYLELESKRKQYSKIVGPMSGPDRKQQSNYDELVAAAGKVYMSNRIQAPLPGLDQIGTLSGSGVFTPGLNSTWVNPKSHSNKGNAWGVEAIKNLDRIDWGDTTKNRITFDGISKTSFDKRAEEGFRNDAGMFILNQIKKEMMTPKTKMGLFTVGASAVATGTMKRGAVVVKPDAEWLKQFVYKTDKDGNVGSGVLSEGQYNSILRNGISYIADATSMNNTLYKSAFQSPIQAYVNGGNTYQYKDPLDPRYNMSVSKNTIGTGDYFVDMEYPLYNPNTGETETVSLRENTTTFGNNIEQMRNQFSDETVDEYKQFNIDLYNGKY